MTETIQATRALRLALEDLDDQAAFRELVHRARHYRPGLSERIAMRTLGRMVRKREVTQLGEIYTSTAARSARRPTWSVSS